MSDMRLISSTEKSERPSYDFNKLRVSGTTYRDDVTIDVKKINERRAKKANLRDRFERALENNNIEELCAFSNRFFIKSGIYSRLCRYMAFLYRYDWMVVPQRFNNKVSDKKVIEGWYKTLLLLDNCELKKTFGEIALKVVKNGCYYGYKIEGKNKIFLQELPIKYCRSNFKLNGKPIVEFNLQYFDEAFKSTKKRLKVLKAFPQEFQKGYVKYKKGTLEKDDSDSGLEAWIGLDPDKAVKFNLNNSDIPLFISLIPKILDLEDAQDLDKKKMEQQLLRLVIQHLPMDKNGIPVFDIQEGQELHKNAVAMLSKTIGIDVLTTFADVAVEDLSDKSNMSAADQLDKVERTVYNESGVSQMQFNTTGNLALEKSIANDEATMTDLLLQFEDYAESLLKPFNKNIEKLYYRVQILPTTIYNYKDLSKIYKEQTQIGFSKLLPQIALGQSQSSVLATALFENDVLHLDEVFRPPAMSSTTSGNQPTEKGKTGGVPSAGPGRPELPAEEQSDKTRRNKESES